MFLQQRHLYKMNRHLHENHIQRHHHHSSRHHLLLNDRKLLFHQLLMHQGYLKRIHKDQSLHIHLQIGPQDHHSLMDPENRQVQFLLLIRLQHQLLDNNLTIQLLRRHLQRLFYLLNYFLLISHPKRLHLKQVYLDHFQDPKEHPLLH